MRLPSKEIVERLRKQYPEGARVELVKMDDVQAPPEGTKGTVTGVDDTGSVLVDWDNGSGLNVVYGEDIVRRICPKCGGPLTGYPALSRIDNKTEICPDCGLIEALSMIGMDEDDQKELVRILHDVEAEIVSK